MSSRYPGGFITKSPTLPTSTSAPGIWTLDQAMEYIKAGTWPVPLTGDAYWEYVTMLAGTTATNGAQNNTFLDSSTNNFTITRNGNTTQGTFTPFSQANGYWSNYFDGTANGSLRADATTDTNLSGDFTLQALVYPTANGQSNFTEILSRGASGAFNGWHFYFAYNYSSSGANRMAFGFNYAGILGQSNTNIPLNQWSHLAITRSGNTFTFYLNGIADGTFTSSSTPTVSGTEYVYVGRASYDTDNRQFTGFITNASIIKDTALTTFNTTTPLATGTSGQSLLTCTANRFIDTNTATTAKILTAGTGVSVIPVTPFGAPTSQYSTSTNGGSGYFDGSGDYLSVASTTDLDITGSFTLEGWVYYTGTSGALMGVGGGGSGWDASTGLQWIFGANTSNFKWQFNSSGSPATISGPATSGYKNQWVHLAVGYNGTTTRFWVNGESAGTTTSSYTVPTTTKVYIGDNTAPDEPTTGYIGSLRFVKGADLYGVGNSTITVPTAPFTTTVGSGTVELLANFTNAGIYDQAAKNDMETVGNAQVSTSVVKYGSGSMAFDGSGDWLKLSNNTAAQAQGFGTGDFTIECWAYITSSTVANNGIYDCRYSSSATGPLLYYIPTSGLFMFYNGANTISGGTITINTWNHVALSRTSGVTKLFINGLQTGNSYADTNNYTSGANSGAVGSFYDGSYSWNGYISDLRITKGYSRYPYSFSPPTRSLSNFYQAPAIASDPYFEYTTLLLPGNGTNGAQNNTFLDSSSNEFSITRNGNTTQGTFSPFSQTGWSVGEFGSTTSYLQTGSDAGLQLGTGDFTVECWAYFTTAGTSGGSENVIMDVRPVSTNGAYFNFGLSNQTVYWDNGSGSYPLVSPTVPLHSWLHIAIVRSGGSSSLYINGALMAGPISDAVNYSCGSTNRIGNLSYFSTGDRLFNGYISNLRITKGGALYTSNFNPSATALTTSVSTGSVTLLTCQSNRFVDNSASGLTFSVNGTVKAEAFSPFNPTSSYSAATVGGSGYFDGTGDYLTSPRVMDTSDFTIEAWIYKTAAGSYPAIMGQGTAGTTGRIGLFIDQSGSPSNRLALQTSGTYLYGTSNIELNQWYHVAVTRESGVTKLYVNGVLENTGSNSDTPENATMYVGASWGPTQYFPGYISNLRISDVARTITVPTAPYTDDANTALLLSLTNAGITDATAKNDFETAGDAQISTTQSKFGGSSIYLDGTGDYLVTRSTVGDYLQLGYGGQQFTLEAWIYPSSTGVYGTIVERGGGNAGWNSTTGIQYTFFQHSSNGVYFQFWTGSTFATAYSAASLAANTWQHVAVVYDGTTTTVYLNGSSTGGSTTTSSYGQPSASNQLRVGAETDGSTRFTGYIQDVRITKGIARYTSNFTPPSTAFLTL